MNTAILTQVTLITTMGVQEFLHLPVFVFLLLLFHSVITSSQYHRDTRQVSIFGMMLQKHIYKTITGAALGDVCLLECYRDVRCQSFNYVFTQGKCELSNRTKEARPEDFVPNSERYYFRRDMKRAHLGAIPELPVDSCKEIKSSEGGQAVSGKYWLNFIKPDTPVLAHCDMKTEDADECNASISVCDVNADCENTLGSYRCFCRAGFSGDGRTCKDVDECNGSNQVCDVNADCKNTIGSYGCSCKAGFFGDGKNCSADPCYSYKNLSDASRKSSYLTPKFPVLCDDQLSEGWYRFVGAAGTKMSTTRVPRFRCGTNWSSWLNGVHPAVKDGKVSRRVCFGGRAWYRCRGMLQISVINCGSYYIYKLRQPPFCSARYCGAD